MTNLQLVEYDPEPGYGGVSTIMKVVAVSTSYSALASHCITQYGIEAGAGPVDWHKYYEIEPSKIVIVPEKH